MSVISGQSITVLFTTRVFSTGVGTNADSLPTSTLYVNGTSNSATVTVTNISTGLYKAAVTLPTLALSDVVQIIVAATVSSVADTMVIWSNSKDFFAGAIPAVVAGGAGGLFIAGSNAATTVNITGNITGTIDTVTTVTGLTASNVGAIKTQTDKLTFTVANQLDSNVQYVNDVQVNGVGSAGNPWGP